VKSQQSLKLRILDYVFYVFLKCRFKKRKKSRFWIFKKRKKRILERILVVVPKDMSKDKAHNSRSRSIQGQVIQCRSLCYQSKARMRLPIGDQWQLWSYLAPSRRYGGL